MNTAKEVSVRVHKSTPECCRAYLLKFAAEDRYRGGGEPGDRIRCTCGNVLVFNPPGWKVAGGA